MFLKDLNNIDIRGGGFFALLALAALLFAWTAVAPCLDNGFTNWDERHYIVENPRIRTLTPAGIKAIFLSRDLDMYSPLSTLSYALNYRFSGLDPKAYHATSAALHLANTLLVLLLVRLLLPGPWPAFFCALFFGVHPAHVESVAWAAERKDVLYSFFFLLSLCAYAAGRDKKNYFAAFALFVCSLLAKPMAVTLPLALLLIDYLKFGAVGRREWLNKVPFFLAAALAAAPALLQPGGPADWALQGRRAAVALYNLFFYVYTLLWPFNLSAMYALPLGGPKFMYVFAGVTAAAAALLWKYCRGNKVIMFGAGFYAAMLLPALQFFPFGPVISADRYTYLSSLGLFIAVAGAVSGFWAGAGPFRRGAAAVLAALVIITFTVAARLRCGVWKDSVTLWSDTLRKQPAAGPALVSLCAAYLRGGQDSLAGACLAEAVRRYPGNDDNWFNLGVLAARRGDLPAAGRCLEQALRINAAHAPARLALEKIAGRGGPARAGRRPAPVKP